MNQQSIESFIQEYQEFHRSFQKKSEEKLKEIFKQFWVENPGINVVTWTQYAPYFNDGEPCEFSVNELTFSNATREEDIDDLGWGEYGGETEGIWGTSEWAIRQYPKEYEGMNPDSVELLCKFINSYPMENVLKNVFGPDNLIIATREGFVSRDYSGQHG